jgi:tetratricopeptide (TPR) repeat protein
MPRRKPAPAPAPSPAKRPPASLLRSRGFRLALAGLALAIIAGGAALQYHRHEQRLAAIPGVAARPDLRGWPEGLATAIAAAETAVFERGNAVEGLARLAALYHANGFYTEAQQAYRTLRQLQPREPKWPHRAAHLHAALGESAEAIDLWRRTLELAPGYVPAQIGLGETLLKSGQPDEASAVFSGVLARDPDNVYARLGLARIDVAGGNWSSAQSRLEAIAAQTDGLLGADLLATVYERSGAPQRGAALRSRQKSHGLYVAVEDPWIDELMDACFDTYRLALESGTAAIRKEPARAEHLISRALEINPSDANLHFHAGQQARQRGELGSARSHLESAVRLDPALTDAWAALVTLQQQEGGGGAAQTLERALAANPDSPVLLLERGRFHKSQGRIGAAMADFRRSAQLRHDDATAAIELARLLLAQNRIDEGIQALEAGLAAEPDHPIALSILAFVGIQARRQELADRCLRQIADQPRVTAPERARLLAEYEKTFGRAFSWAP